MGNSGRATAYIDLSAIENNFRLIRSKVAPNVKVLCVVKADAYGHGVVPVSKRLQHVGVDCLGVAGIYEGVNLRDHGIVSPVLVMGGVMPWDDVMTAVAYNLSVAVHDFSTLERIVEVSVSFPKELKVHLKFDTGMGRLGFTVNDADRVAHMLSQSRNVLVEGVMSHFSASESRNVYGLDQISLFGNVRKRLAGLGVRPSIAHMANSGAISVYPEAHYDMVRAGISLYGSHSDQLLAKNLPVLPVMKLVSHIATVRDVPKGSALSYGRTFTTRCDSKIAYVPVGYADGYPRSLSNRGKMLVKGLSCPVVGRVCMDWTIVDVTGVEGGVRAGDEVVLIGKDASATITADELAVEAGTIPYEILCKISSRIPRVYI